MKKILFITYHFPPAASSGVFRSLGFARHLSAMGWQIQVLTVNEQGAESIDRDLLNKLPDGVQIFQAARFDPFSLWSRIRGKRTPNGTTVAQLPPSEAPPKKPSRSTRFKEVLSHLLKTPDSQIGWLLPALWKARGLDKPDLIYSSAPPFTGHLIAGLLKKRWRVPLVCDFRDPWLDNPFRVERPGLAETWDRKLEGWVFKMADTIIANTEPMAEALCKRHPEAASRISVITNGFDPEDFLDIQPHRDNSEQQMLLVHPGSLYGQRDPRQFLEGLRIAILEGGCSQIQVQLIGPSEKFGGQSLQEHVAHLELTDHVEIIPSVRHAQALARMKGADMLLLFSQGTHLQIPAKIFEYMGLGKSIFAVCESASATEGIMISLGDRHFSSTNDSDNIAHNLAKAYRQWATQNTPSESVQSHGGTKPFLRETLTRRLAGLMHAVLGQESL